MVRLFGVAICSYRFSFETWRTNEARDNVALLCCALCHTIANYCCCCCCCSMCVEIELFLFVSSYGRMQEIRRGGYRMMHSVELHRAVPNDIKKLVRRPVECGRAYVCVCIWTFMSLIPFPLDGRFNFVYCSGFSKLHPIRYLCSIACRLLCTVITAPAVASTSLTCWLIFQINLFETCVPRSPRLHLNRTRFTVNRECKRKRTQYDLT